MATALRTYVDSTKPANKTQREALPGQVANSAGGFSFEVDMWSRLRRFIILGTEGGSYYTSEKKLTADNAKNVEACLKADGARVIRLVTEISQAGSAPKNDPALFTLALATAVGDEATRKAAFDALPLVARTGTHLLHFVAFVDGLRGWGRGLRRAVGNWYQNQSDFGVALQVAKYANRDGWTQADVLRLTHPKPATDTRKAVYGWVVDGVLPDVIPSDDKALAFLSAVEDVKKATSVKEAVRLIADYRLPREVIPTQFLTEAAVWEALLADMPMTAMIRNLATMTRVGVIAPLSAGSKKVIAELGDGERIRKSRVHPMQVLSALKTYAQGHGQRGNNTWTPVQTVIDALDGAFYSAFGNVERTDKNWLLALDVSGSMDGGEVAGVPGMTPRVASAAMALITAATQPNHFIVGFTSGSFMSSFSRYSMNRASLDDVNGLSSLAISPKMRLDDVIRYLDGLPMGGTDCSLPLRYARVKKMQVDMFATYTDSETWAGPQAPSESLKAYRREVNPAARSAVVGLLANPFTIADPNDAGMLDLCGFDSSAPQVLSDFAMGRF